TSLIRFIERRFSKQYPGIIESNITPWRRAISGDLTSAFDFDSCDDDTVTLPGTAGYVPPDNVRHPDYIAPPPTDQDLPQQERGTRPARALPYELHVDGEAHDTLGTIKLRFRNTGSSAAVFQVRSGDGLTGPWTYTVGAGDETSDDFGSGSAAPYDLSVYGPNGFFRAFAGSLRAGSANLTVRAVYERESEGIALVIRNHGSGDEKVTIFDAYCGEKKERFLESGESFSYYGELRESHGWYDFKMRVESDSTFLRTLAGHVETGRHSVTDPAIGGEPRHGQDEDKD
ncbi:MAG: phospholipase domain-containing protein, partial [Candidatus Acidiferrales bacterium]